MPPDAPNPLDAPKPWMSPLGGGGGSGGTHGAGEGDAGEGDITGDLEGLDASEGQAVQELQGVLSVHCHLRGQRDRGDIGVMGWQGDAPRSRAVPTTGVWGSEHP